MLLIEHNSVIDNDKNMAKCINVKRLNFLSCTCGDHCGLLLQLGCWCTCLLTVAAGCDILHAVDGT